VIDKKLNIALDKKEDNSNSGSKPPALVSEEQKQIPLF
jgi:hypothetical protein